MMPVGIAVCVTEKAKGVFSLTTHRASNCELAGVATAALAPPEAIQGPGNRRRVDLDQ
jgi:hypothetical protein